MNSGHFEKQHSWVPIDKKGLDIRIKPNRNSSPVIKKTQFSLMLAWKCTVHMVQSISLPQIVMRFQLLKQRNFNYGQIYVAVSRVKCFEGLYVLDSLTFKAIRANPRVLDEYNGPRSESMLVVRKENLVDKKGLMITLLNIRFLNKHAIDLA